MAKKDETLTREGAGSWRTKDGRFLIRGEGGGRWFIVDQARRDPFGLELISGPYSTIAAARAAIDGARLEFPEGSPPPETPPTPVAPDRPRPAPKTAKVPRGDTAAGAPAMRQPARGAAPAPPTEEAGPKSAPRVEPPVEPPRVEPPVEPTWLDALAPTERRAARLRIRELERLEVAGADDLVRRDFEAGTPEVARALLRRQLAAIVAAAPDPTAARAMLVEVLRLLTFTGRDMDAAPALPGWHLVETVDGHASRRIQLDGGDLAGAETPRRRAR